MRPPKVILLAGDDDLRVSELRYMLRILGYRPIARGNPAEAERVLLETHIDLLLVVCPLDGGEWLLKRSKVVAPYVPTLVVLETEAFLPPGWAPDSALCRGQCSSAAIVERLKLLTARKRGPRKGAQYKPGTEPEP
jgi:hypothetical protein